jgi:ferredoxin
VFERFVFVVASVRISIDFGVAMRRYTIDRLRCIRCGASSSLAPDVVRLDPTSARINRQPATDAEESALETARLMCPVGAIRRKPV